MIDNNRMVDMDKACRSCMCEMSDMRNVFETITAVDGDFQIAEMLMACASVEVSKFSVVKFVCALFIATSWRTLLFY